MIKILEEKQETGYKKYPVTQEQLQREYDYARAQKLLKSLLDEGLISEAEFNRITLLNRQTFSPALSEIMPGNT